MRILLLCIAAFVFEGAAFSTADAASMLRRSNSQVVIGEHRFVVELARSPQEWSRGLMFRDRLAPFEGMLFLGSEDSEERTQQFWMKNVPISLDLIFISRSLKIVDIHHKATPLSEESIFSRQPALHVLEIRGGRSKELGIKLGDRVEFKISE
ncbi:MAG: DUF192 domain-containing protein [Bradymonadales bacterium]|nr:MAG: DUF192 domain-containing protein [Bradymonadales bacterium]